MIYYVNTFITMGSCHWPFELLPTFWICLSITSNFSHSINIKTDSFDIILYLPHQAIWVLTSTLGLLSVISNYSHSVSLKTVDLNEIFYHWFSFGLSNFRFLLAIKLTAITTLKNDWKWCWLPISIKYSTLITILIYLVNKHNWLVNRYFTLYTWIHNNQQYYKGNNPQTNYCDWVIVV